MVVRWLSEKRLYPVTLCLPVIHNSVAPIALVDFAWGLPVELNLAPNILRLPVIHDLVVPTFLVDY